MNKTLIALLTVVGLVHADGIKIDFGRFDSQTDGFYNIHTAKSIYRGQQGANYVNDESSATTTHKLKLDGQNVLLCYEHTTGVKTGGLGMMPTLIQSEEEEWKNPYSGELPDGVTGNVNDSLTTQAEHGNGTHRLIFTGLKPGTYSLTGFGAYCGKDKMSSVRVSLDNHLTADWVCKSCINNAWHDNGSLNNSSLVFFRGVGDVVGNKGYYFCANDITVGEDGILSLTIAGESGVWSRTPLNYIALRKASALSTTGLVLISVASLGGLGFIAWLIYRRRSSCSKG